MKSVKILDSPENQSARVQQHQHTMTMQFLYKEILPVVYKTSCLLFVTQWKPTLIRRYVYKAAIHLFEIFKATRLQARLICAHTLQRFRPATFPVKSIPIFV